MFIFSQLIATFITIRNKKDNDLDTSIFTAHILLFQSSLAWKLCKINCIVKCTWNRCWIIRVSSLCDWVKRFCLWTAHLVVLLWPRHIIYRGSVSNKYVWNVVRNETNYPSSYDIATAHPCMSKWKLLMLVDRPVTNFSPHLFVDVHHFAYRENGQVKVLSGWTGPSLHLK